MTYTLQPVGVNGNCWGADYGVLALIVRPLQLLIASPVVLILAALTAMLLSHPDVPFYQVTRAAFALMMLGLTARAVVLRQPLLVFERASWPMLGLLLIGLGGVLSRPFDREAWSLLAAKYAIPCAMFHFAGPVFADEKRARKFEKFTLAVLSYLSLTAIAFLVGAHALIFPRFILDPTLGYHVDRARGPFLQAVANGVSLNILGLLAFLAYRGGRLRGLKAAVLLGAVPVAILATMTRSVWLSFAGTMAALIMISGKHALRRAAVVLVLIAAAGVALLFSDPEIGRALNGRLTESNPVEFREALYAGSWRMFLDRPLSGWGFHQMPLELPKYVSEYREKLLYPHNTYLEILVEHGVTGLALYLWVMWELWRLGRGAIPSSEKAGFLGYAFHRSWPILLAVYWVNAAVVVMSYQFVNGMIFTLAGMLAAQHRRALSAQRC